MTQRFFIAGTDTGVGKTRVTVALIHALTRNLHQAIAAKPIASGTMPNIQPARNEDALDLYEAQNHLLPIDVINPILFDAPISPNLAAEKHNRIITSELVLGLLQPFFNYPHNIALIEGAGGWHCPLNKTETFADLATALNAKIILVVGIRLGCLNHSLLTCQAIQASGLSLAGWVANCIDPNMAALDENIRYLKDTIHAPCLGMIPTLKTTDPASYAAYLDTSIFERNNLESLAESLENR